MEDKTMYERSNMFANIECKFKYADEEAILDSIKESGSVILQSGLAEQTITGILIMCANYGLGGKGTLSNKQKKAVDVFLGIMFTGDINDLYDDMCQPLNESEIETIAVLG